MIESFDVGIRDDKEHLARTIRKMAKRSNEDLLDTIIRASRIDAELTYQMIFDPIRQQDIAIMKKELMKRLERRDK